MTADEMNIEDPDGNVLMFWGHVPGRRMEPARSAGVHAPLPRRRSRRPCLPTAPRRPLWLALRSPTGSRSSSTRSSSSRKAQNLQRNPKIALVIGGLSDGEERTVRTEGLADEPAGDELERLKQAYYHVYPDGPSRLRWPG